MTGCSVVVKFICFDSIDHRLIKRQKTCDIDALLLMGFFLSFNKLKQPCEKCSIALCCGTLPLSCTALKAFVAVSDKFQELVLYLN